MKKSRTLKRGWAALVTAAFFLVLALSYAGMILFSANYHRIYNSPSPAVEGCMDFEGYPLASRAVDSVLAGEWEFFYNRWIVTDGDDAPADGYISVPGRWTGRKVNGEKLGRSGYASYRLVIENVEAGTPVRVWRKNYPAAFRVYINGELNAVSGAPTREKDAYAASGLVDEEYPYLADGNPLTVVIEFSYSETGGLTAAPWLCGRVGTNAVGKHMGTYAMLMVGIALTTVIASALFSAGMFRYRRDISLPFLLLALFLHMAFSKDTTPQAFMAYASTLWVSGIALVFAGIFLVWHLLEAGMKMKKRELAVYGGCGAGLILLMYLLRGTAWCALPALLLCAQPLLLCYFLLTSPMQKKYRITYCTLVFLLSVILSFEFADGLGLIVFGTEVFLSVVVTLIIGLFALGGFFRIRATTREILRASELERELERVKQQALKAQIKPHFIFNSLTAVQSLYHQNIAEGDMALERFARHLRLNVDADGAETVPFEEEVKNILNYFELENLRLGGTLTLLLDITYTDFSVPVLSLQPLVENAIRHAETHRRENGFISLASVRKGDTVFVTIADNGKGFDPVITPEGVGLTNSRERLNGLIGASMTVKSSQNEGTEITIAIPMPEGDPA